MRIKKNRGNLFINCTRGQIDLKLKQIVYFVYSRRIKRKRIQEEGVDFWFEKNNVPFGQYRELSSLKHMEKLFNISLSGIGTSNLIK